MHMDRQPSAVMSAARKRLGMMACRGLVIPAGQMRLAEAQVGGRGGPWRADTSPVHLWPRSRHEEVLSVEKATATDVTYWPLVRCEEGQNKDSPAEIVTPECVCWLEHVLGIARLWTGSMF